MNTESLNAAGNTAICTSIASCATVWINENAAIISILVAVLSLVSGIFFKWANYKLTKTKIEKEIELLSKNNNNDT